MSQDKQTVNVLILELATMVVAISLAFTSTLVSTFSLNSIISFIFTNVIVIWFWWGYVVDRLSFPPKTMRFPVLDILILILIALIPFALRLGHIYYLSGVVGSLIIIWSFMIRYIIIENSNTISLAASQELNVEVKQRLVIGPIFILDATVGILSADAGVDIFVGLVISIIVWNVARRRRRNGRKANAEKAEHNYEREP